METSEQTTQKQHKLRTSRVFLNGVLCILAAFLAIIYLREAFLIAYFATASIMIAVIAFFIKLRQSMAYTREASPLGPVAQHKKMTIFVLMAVLAFPFFLFILARFLEPTVWFLLLASVASGIGLSEVIFYSYFRTLVHRK